jgi:hypothetical protein
MESMEKACYLMKRMEVMRRANAESMEKALHLMKRMEVIRRANAESMVERKESMEGIMADRPYTSAEDMKDEFDTSVEGMANQLGNSIMIGQFDISPQPMGYEQPDFHKELTHSEFDIFLDSPDQPVSMNHLPNVDMSSQHFDVTMGRSPLPTEINPAELSRELAVNDTHVEMTHSANDATDDSMLKEFQLVNSAPCDAKRKRREGPAKRRKGTKRRSVNKGRR